MMVHLDSQTEMKVEERSSKNVSCRLVEKKPQSSLVGTYFRFSPSSKTVDLGP